MHYPPEATDASERSEFKNDMDAMNGRIRWSTTGDDGGMAQSSAIPADVRAVEHHPHDDDPREWTIDVEIPCPVDVTLADPDKSQRAYEVMQALADGKAVTIEGEEGDN